MLTQTAFLFSVKLSYDDLSGDMQGLNTLNNSGKDSLSILPEDDAICENEVAIASLASSLITDNILVYYAEPEINLSMPKLETINVELTLMDDIDAATPIEPEVAPEPIQSVVKYVNANKLNVRSEPTSQSQLVTSIKRGDKVTYYQKVGDWAQITTWTDQKGYILAKYLVDSASKVDKVIAQQPVKNQTKDPVVASRGETEAPPISAEGQTLADEIIVYAKTFLGVKYRWGQSSPSGFDCSGFTNYVFAHFGIKLSRSSYDYPKFGTKISKSDLQKGDILMWDTQRNGTIGHVGIYMGDGMFIHASSSKGKVVTRSVSSYKEKYMGARRVIK